MGVRVNLGTTVALVTTLAAVGVAGALVLGAWRWRRRTRALRARLMAARAVVAPGTPDPDVVRALPEPVRRYLHAVLPAAPRIVAAARFTHEGQFDMGKSTPDWRPFTSDQMAVIRPPGFDWDARVRLAPGLTAFVHDAYAAGEGILHAELLALIMVADLRGPPHAAAAELMRYLAETAWYPTALLLGQGVRWEAIDDQRARGTLTDGATTVSLDFHFDGEGLLAAVKAPARYRGEEGGVARFAPWEGRFWSYAVRDGMRIPLEAEVAWADPDGPRPYWRGRITGIRYGFTD